MMVKEFWGDHDKQFVQSQSGKRRHTEQEPSLEERILKAD
jgi:hypothetical protein